MGAALMAMLMELPLGAIAGWGLAGWLAVVLMQHRQATARHLLISARDRAALGAAYADLAQARDEAMRTGQQLDGVLGGTSDGVQILDPDSRLALWNDRFPDSTGVPRELLRIGMSLEDMLRGQAQAGEFGAVDVETEVARRLKLMRGHRELGVVERTRPNGQVVELRRTPMPDGGIVTLYTDVTARRRAEAARREAERLRTGVPQERARFVALVGAAMDSRLARLRDAVAEGPGGQADAMRHCRSAQRLMQDVVQLSRLEAGRVALAAAPFELRPLLDGLVAEQRGAAEQRSLQLRLAVAPDVPGWVLGDAAALTRVIGAMLQDAIAFAPPGPVGLSVSRLGLGSQPILQVAVRDGLKPATAEAAPRLFLPFARPRDGAEAQDRATGLELAIAAGLVELMHGQIGQGDAEGARELWASLPLPIAQPAPSDRGDRPAAPLPVMPRPQRRAFVLLVEDIVVNQVVTATQLRRDGHRVDVAEDGATAIRMAASAPYDMVFMDLMMPGMSGFEATQHIRGLPGPAGTMPIIALTANTSLEDRDRCREAGMMEMLSKPVRPNELSAALTRALAVGRSADPAPAPAAPPAAASAAPLPPRPAAPPETDHKLLDHARLAELREGLPVAMFIDLAEQCLAEMDNMLVDLQGALDRGEPAKVDAAAHALAGMAGGYGLAEIDRRMRRIMAAARGGDLEAARADSLDIQTVARRSAAALRAMLADCPTPAA